MRVEVESTARAVEHNGVRLLVPEPCELSMRYDEADPYAVEFEFREGTDSVTWRFARELLAAGLERWADDDPEHMDVRVWRGIAPGVVWLRLTGWDGTVLAALRRDHVEQLLRRSYVLVPKGKEQVDVDEWVSKLLAER